MKRITLLKEANDLGDDSWELFHFVAVQTKGRRAVADALDQDARWIRDHAESVAHRINILARRVREEGIDDSRGRSRRAGKGGGR